MSAPETQLRTWWENYLGATQDSAGTWEVQPNSGYPDFPVAGEFTTLRITSFGTQMDAELFRPNTWNGGCVVVPFYDTPAVFGAVTQRTRETGPKIRNALAIGVAERDLAVLAVPWWCEIQAAADPNAKDAKGLFERYGAAAARHIQEHSVTALGRAIADVHLAVTAAKAEKLVDPSRLGALGHSLGGKLALFLGALDPTIKATVSHELGLGFDYSNWSDPWYFADRVPEGRDLDEVVSLVAPRNLLMVGGDGFDGQANRFLIDRAKPSWPDEGGLDVLYHDGGHPMPLHVQRACAHWLAERL